MHRYPCQWRFRHGVLRIWNPVYSIFIGSSSLNICTIVGYFECNDAPSIDFHTQFTAFWRARLSDLLLAVLLLLASTVYQMPFSGSSRPPLHNYSAGPGPRIAHISRMAPETCASRPSMCQARLECDGVSTLPDDSQVSELHARHDAIAERRARKKQPRLDKTRIPCPWDPSQCVLAWGCWAHLCILCEPERASTPVSYTHLTLPTILLV